MLQVPQWKVGFRGEVVGRDALPTLLPAWEDLCRRSIEDNVYYAPRYARALLDSVEKDKSIGFAVAWGDGRLVAMLPIERPRLLTPLLQPACRAWQTKYTFSCTPLLDRFRAAEAADALLDVLASISGGAWVIPTVNTAGEACNAIRAALARRGLPWVMLHEFQRASLEAGGTFDEHMEHHVSSKRRKDLARNRRRLEKLGRVEHEIHSVGEGLDHAVSAFLEIEARGWKGKRGTALACNDATREFARAAFTGDESGSACRADVLTLNRVPIAVSLIALAGGTGFTVKGAYDERYRDCSAGLLLELELIRSFLAGNWASRLDAATAGAHVIDDLWPGRVEVADLAFSLSPRGAALCLSAFRAFEETKASMKAVFKRGLRRLGRS